MNLSKQIKIIAAEKCLLLYKLKSQFPNEMETYETERERELNPFSAVVPNERMF